MTRGTDDGPADEAPSTDREWASEPPPLTLETLGPKVAYLYGLTGVFLPWVGLIAWAAWGLAAMPEWQSGQASDHAYLLMLPTSTWPFWPLVAMSSWAVSNVIAAPTRLGHRPWVRLGLIAGVVMGSQFTILVWGILDSSFILGTVGVASVMFYADLHSKAPMDRTRNRRPGGDLTVGCSLLLCAVVLLTVPLACGINEASSAPIRILVASWPTALLVTCAMALCRIRRSSSFRPPKHDEPIPAAALAGTAAAYVAGWVVSIQTAIAHYDSLPVEEPPDSCYVASAACRGHRRWVRSEWVEAPDGTPFLINDQLRTLKAGELALQAVWPRAHRALRRVYDRMGPTVAAKLRRAWLADAAYASLIPAALATRLVFRLLGIQPTVCRWPARPDPCADDRSATGSAPKPRA